MKISMKILLLVILVCLVLAAISYFSFRARVKFAVEYSKTVNPYQKITTDYSKTILVLGDSTSTSIGATNPEDSVAGRLADLAQATYVENLGASGAQVTSLAGQIAQAKLPHYDIVLIQVGANDIVRFHNVQATAAKLGEALDTLKLRAGKIFMMAAADVGTATLFPSVVRPFHSWFTQKYHQAFGETCRNHGAIYVNLYEPRATDPFVHDPAHYLAPDQFHPSSLGYGFWFEKLKKAYLSS